ncbi:hypothetical protein NWF32_22525 [Pseudomonas qingdaonensis]|nr:hypothetical protein [Pseudomonas qingdaonensis]
MRHVLGQPEGILAFKGRGCRLGAFDQRVELFGGQVAILLVLSGAVFLASSSNAPASSARVCRCSCRVPWGDCEASPWAD